MLRKIKTLQHDHQRTNSKFITQHILSVPILHSKRTKTLKTNKEHINKMQGPFRNRFRKSTKQIHNWYF